MANSRAAMPKQPTLRWATGPVGGSWHQIVTGLAGLLASEGITIDVVAAGGRDNPGHVERGECELGTTIDFVAKAALDGRTPYLHAHPHLRCIGNGWSPLPLHFVGPRNEGASLLRVLQRGRVRLGIPPPSTFDELSFQRAMHWAGTSYHALAAAGGRVLHADYRALPEAFVQGEIDYFFGATSSPGAPVQQLSRRPGGARLLPIDDALIAHLHEHHGYGRGTIRQSDYPELADADLPTPVMDTVFLVHANMADEVVYRLVHALLHHRLHLHAIHPSLAAFDPARSLATCPVPLHPGAHRAYAEAGFAPGDSSASAP